MGQKICGGHDNDHIAEKGNYKGLRAFSKAFHGTGSGNGYSRNKKAGADDLQCSGASGNGFRGSCEKSHKLSGSQEADNGSKDVGRILRTFKIKKNVEVTDNGKIII